ncbi:MAG: glucosaminidase domain-containing protein [Flavobacteriales bacterium]|jgi:Bax protein|tara:strand:- start:3561 stop:4349 length:789 start_codon:yes stop_codon:yes gene_type:complete
MKKTYILFVFLLLSFPSVFAQTFHVEFIEVSGSSVSTVNEVGKLVDAYVYQSAIDLSDLDVPLKKQAFINLMLPSILIAKHKLELTRNSVLAIVNSEFAPSIEDEVFLIKLKKSYKCKSNKELLSRLQTHPTSIVIAQAALESGWGTSRFYREANNIFGVWSYSKNEARIRASETRDGTVVYVKKYASLPESIASYFKTLARGPYSSFREEREKTEDVYLLTPHLKVYSELKEEYVLRLEKLIRYNKLEQYDTYVLKVNFKE